MTGWLFRASWPILDPAVPMSALQGQAARQIPVIAADVGAQLVGRPRWYVVASRLIVEAPARPVPREPSQPVAVAASIAEYTDSAVLIERAVAGHTTPRLATADRVEAVSRLVAAGLSDGQIGQRLWWWRNSANGAGAVCRFRRWHHIPSAIPCTRTRKAA